jgi:hypothetical protein
VTATVRYPANQITPHGWYFLTQGDQPTIRLRAYDGSIDIYLMGGHSIADRHSAPECVQIAKGGLTGLIPPWKHIDQKGATQDGVHNIDSLYDPIEVGLKVRCRGRSGRRVRQVVRDVIASLDAKQQSELSFLDLDAGYWWAKVRWFQGAPPNPFSGGQNEFQDISLRLRADNGFWRSYDDTTSFSFAYEAMTDTFDTDHSGAHDLGPNWPQRYSGPGAGYCSTTTAASGQDQARWYESGSEQREVVNGPYKDFSTDTDNQVVSMVLGSLPEITFTGGAYDDLWGRMSRNVDGTWKGDGIRARVGMNSLFFGWVQLSRFNNFVETVLFERPMFIPPLFGEKYTLVCGTEDDPRMFRIMRNGVPILSHKEVGTSSHLGAAYRGVGFGMSAGDALIGQKEPAWIRKVSAGDNATITQSGFLSRNNIGDQPMYDDYTFIGPGTVRIWDGPGAGPDNYVEFGPLLTNQTAFLRTDPRDRNVYDLAAIRATPTQQEASIFQSSLDGLLSFLSLSNANPILQVVQSIFGVFGGPAPSPPQGNFYSLLKGRFSNASAIPAKSPGNPVTPYHVKVQIVGGNADSKLIASGVPLRRYPL